MAGTCKGFLVGTWTLAVKTKGVQDDWLAEIPIWTSSRWGEENRKPDTIEDALGLRKDPCGLPE